MFTHWSKYFSHIPDKMWGWFGEVRCRVSCITEVSNWYWLTVGQGLLSLQQVWVEGECFCFFCFFTFIQIPHSPLSLSFISTTIPSICFLPFSGRWHNMTNKDWCFVKPQHNQSMTKCGICFHLIGKRTYLSVSKYFDHVNKASLQNKLPYLP